MNQRIRALEQAVARYEKTMADFAAINEELRTLPMSVTLADILAMNEQSMATTARLLDASRQRLQAERVLAASSGLNFGQTATA